MRQAQNDRTTRVWSATEVERLRREYPALSREELVELVLAYRAGSKEAGERVVYANIGLVFMMAKRFGRYGVSQKDLIQAGLLVMREEGLKKFDLSRGTAWSTFILPWLRHAMQRLICNEGTDRATRTPIHLHERRIFLAKVQSRYYAIHGRTLQGEELLAEARRTIEQRTRRRLAKKLKREPAEQEISKDLDKNARYRLTVDKVNDALCSNRPPVLLDAPSFVEGGESVGDNTADSSSPEKLMELAVQAKDIERASEMVMSAVRRLDERSQDILRQRFGLDGSTPRTLWAIADDSVVTRERIRQIECKAIRRIAVAIRREPDNAAMALEAIGERARNGNATPNIPHDRQRQGRHSKYSS